MKLHGKSPRAGLALTTALASGLLLPAVALAQTTNGVLPNAGDAAFTPGQVTITGGGPTAGSTLNVAVNQPTAVIDWFHFDVPAGDTVNFSNNSLASTAAVLNRVRAGGSATAGPSVINGTINASNVEVWLQNPDGMVFGAGVAINAAGFVATAADVAAPDFTDGNNSFRFLAPAGSTARISGGGAGASFLTNGGKLAFIAPAVAVEGSFNAGTGSVAFVTATDVTMTANPGSPLGLTINAGTTVGGDAQVVNGTVNGGEAYFVLASRSSVVDALLSVGATVTTSAAVANGRGVTLMAGSSPSLGSGVVFTGVPTATSGTAGIRQSGTISASGAGQQVSVASNGAVVGDGAITANGNVLGSTSGDLSLGDVTSTAGSVALAGRSVTAGTVGSGTVTTATVTTGSLGLGSVAAGGDVSLSSNAAGSIVVSGALTSATGGASIETTGPVSLGSVDVAGLVSIGAIRQPTSITVSGTAAGSALSLRTSGALNAGTLIARTGDLTINAASLDGAGAPGANVTATSGAVLVNTSGAASMARVSAGGLIRATGSAVTVGDVTGGDRLLLTATGGALRVEGDAVVAGDVILSATGPAAIASLTSTGGLISLGATGAISGIGAAGGDLNAAGAVTIVSDTTLSLDALRGTSVLARSQWAAIGSATATAGNVSATATNGDASLGGGGASNDLVLAATGSATTSGNLMVGRDYRVSGRDVAFGAGTQRAGRQTIIVAAGGSITGGNGLTLIGDGAGVGVGNAIILDASGGSISLAGSRLLGGDNRSSDVALRLALGSPLVLGDVAARSLGVTGGAYGAVTPIVRDAAIALGNIETSTPFSVSTTVGDLKFGSIRTFDPGAAVTLAASGAGGDIIGNDITSAGSVNLAATDITVRNITATRAGATLTATATNALTLAGDANVAGNVSLVAGGAAALGSVTSINGLIDVDATGAITGVGVGGGDLMAAGTVTVASDAGVTLDSLEGSVVTVTGAAATVGNAKALGDVKITATSGDASLGGGGSANDVMVLASGIARASGDIRADRDYRVDGSSILLGSGGQSAGRFARIVARDGSITGGVGLNLVGEGDPGGNENGVVLDAANGGISIAGSLVRGGVAGTTDVALRFASGTSIALGSVVARELGVTDASYDTLTPIAHDASISFENVATLNPLSVLTTNGNITAGNVSSNGAVTLTASGVGGTISTDDIISNSDRIDLTASAITSRDVTATSSAGAIRITAGGALVSRALSAGPGGIEVQTGQASVVSATTQGPVLVRTTAGPLNIDTAKVTGSAALTLDAGGDLSTQSVENLGGSVTLKATGNIRATTVSAPIGAITITAGGSALLNSVTQQSAAGIVITAGSIDARAITSTLGSVSLTSTTGGIAVDTLGAGANLGLTSATDLTATTIDVSSGNATLASTNGAVTLSGNARVGGDLKIAGNRVALGVDDDSETVSATGTIDVTARAGGIVGGNELTLISDRDGLGGRHVFLDATGGDIAFAPTSSVYASLAPQTSSIGIRLGTAGTNASFGLLSANRVGQIDPGRSMFSPILIGGSFTAARSFSARQAVNISATAGITLAAVAVSDVGAGINLISGGNVIAASATAPGAITVTAGGGASLTTVRSSDAGVTVRGGTVNIGTAAARTALDLRSTGGSLTLGSGSAGTTATLASASDLTVTGALTGPAGVTVTAVRDASLGQVDSSAGAVNVTAGSINVSTASAAADLTLRANAGSLTLGNGTAGGAATVSSSGSLTIAGQLAGATSASLTAGGAASIGIITSSGGSVGVTAASATIDTAAAKTALSVEATGGSLTLGNGTAGTTARLTSAGDATVSTALTSGGAATVAAANARLASVRATNGSVEITTSGAATGVSGGRANFSAGGAGNDVRVTAGGEALLGTLTAADEIALRGMAVDVTSATATSGPLDITATAGNITVGTGVAGTLARLTATGDATVPTSLTSGGTTTVTAANARLASVNATNGSVDVTTSGATTGVAGGRGNLVAGGAGNDVRVNAGGSVLLGTVTAADEVSLRGTAVDVTTPTATTGALGVTATAGNVAVGTGTAATSVAINATGSAIATRLVAGTTLGVTSGGALSLGSAQAGGAATLDAGGVATLGAVTAGPTLSLRATDATISGAQRAGKVTITNRTPATTTLRLGDATGSDGFRLSAAELGFIETDALTLDSGAGAVEVGTLAFGSAAGRNTVDVLTTGRIDVRGPVTGAGASRVFRFGGSANAADRASSIFVATTANGGGRLLFSTADLELRGTRIAQGQSAGFLDVLAPLSPADVPTRFVNNPSSSLYSASAGGVPYETANQTTISANRLTVRYSDYALFQNTGQLGENLGAVITTTTGSGPSVSFIGSGSSGDIGAVALFGRVNGVSGIETALLGPAVVGAQNINIRAGRINGCLINSGGGCITNVVAQPALNVFDASRTQILRAADNLAVPFDPVVGTNNEALFSGVSSIDVPLDETPPPPDCPEGSTDPNCPPKQETQP